MVVTRLPRAVQNQPVLSVDDLSFAYDMNGPRVLNHVSVAFFPGEITLVTGRSGCGKSTLAYCIAGLVPDLVSGCWSGEVHAFIDGERLDPFETRTACYSAHVGFISQNPDDQLVSFDVKEEIAFGLENLLLPPDVIHKRVDQVARVLGLEALLDAPVDTLSGGEKQLVSIASQLVMGQRVLVMDEPFSYLDGDNRDRLLDVLASVQDRTAEGSCLLPPGLSLVIIDHDVEHVARIAHRVVILGKGGAVISDLRDSFHDLHATLVPPCFPRQRALPRELAPAVELRNVGIAYGDVPVLNNVSLRIHAGEMVGVHGRNGSGKTSLLMAMAGVVPPAYGQVLVSGMELSALDDVTRFSRIGFVFQNPEHQLFCQSVKDEVMYSAKNFEVEVLPPRLVELLSMVDPDTITGEENPFTLSWGQKRRLNVASALSHQPGVLFLDEPFIGHDAGFKAGVIRGLHDLVDKGVAVTVVSHDMTFLNDHCDARIHVRDGSAVVERAKGVSC